ncbi:hypothetical protein CCY99_08070 [Helicobacter sp. 16-1353]|uniref:acyl-CoA reductase n=1 Tax=Helicobacter sp. 16-1353 TaxID=2004996 RepID=UPI000DCCDB68|nr:acyl-CoA reductase [Helicobacter sp. 16-1353]RAX51905.1 hypothetical protein CCY99_08070 [Helicobacter sp. 16-1353]
MQRLEVVGIPMKINYILGNEEIYNTPMAVCSDEVCSYLSEISTLIFKSPYTRIYKDLASLGFWCRSANIHTIKSNILNIQAKLGRGLCFHIAPANIPINFAFSYFFGLLAGNSNIVRLPSKRYEQNIILCEIISNIIDKYPNVKKATTFVEYPRESQWSQEFSTIADCRMIWGGDETIKLLKSYTTKPRCVDVCFCDRYSICIINGDSIKKLDDTALTYLANNFYNDTYSMDQNACSSPQIVYWINDDIESRERFWRFIAKNANKYILSDIVAIDKFTSVCINAIDSYEAIKSFKRDENILYRIEINNANAINQTMRGIGGLFYECVLNDIDELFLSITEKCQTITYFGLDSKEILKGVITNNIRGIDRIVPIGNALDISVKWDGYDIISMLCREIIL